LKRAVAAIIAALFAIASFVQPAHAAEIWEPTIDYSQGWEFPEENHIYVQEGSIQQHSVIKYTSDVGQKHCLELGPKNDCLTNKSGYVYGQAIIPVCTTKVESCIEKVWIYKDGEQPVEAEFVRTNEGYQFTGNPSKSIPSGGGQSIFKAKEPHSGGGNLYAINAPLQISVRNGKVFIERFDLSVTPVVDQPQPEARAPKLVTCDPKNSPKDWLDCLDWGNFEGNGDCLYQQNGICGKAHEFAPETRVAVQIKLSNEVSGWFKGRLKDPRLQVSKIDNLYSTVSVDASPVSVSRFYHRTHTKFGEPSLTSVIGHRPGTGAWYSLFENNRTETFKVLDTYRAYMNDTAPGVTTHWSFGSINKFEIASGAAVDRCFKDQSRLLGLVTTNATLFEPGAPKFTQGSLNYTVSGLHFMPDGKTESLGSYDLVMRSDTARCLYGFSNAPLSATVSVTGGTSKNVATTVVSEKNGWLKMAAYGFTFSKKTIKVKITKAKKTTITCVAVSNGKIRKVTAVNPVCAKGFVKK
jgi:hypothetical protein